MLAAVVELLFRALRTIGAHLVAIGSSYTPCSRNRYKSRFKRGKTGKLQLFEVAGSGFEPSLTDPESVKPSRSELVDLIDNYLLTLPSA